MLFPIAYTHAGYNFTVRHVYMLYISLLVKKNDGRQLSGFMDYPVVTSVHTQVANFDAQNQHRSPLTNAI